MRLYCVVLLLLCVWCVCDAQQALQLRFIPQTLRASWSPRWDSNIEWYPHPLTFVDTTGTTRQWTSGRTMVLQGDGGARTNDIWASSDAGISWWLIAGRTSNVSAGGGHATTSFSPVTGRAATGIDNQQRIYRIAGNLPDGSKSNAVWMTADGGQTWRNQMTVQGALAFIPNRDRSSVMVDASDALYLIGGEVRGDPGTLNTDSSFKSTDQGITWQLQPSTPWQARSTGLFLNHRSPQLDNREILTYLTGWDGVKLWNEVWISSDLAQTWSRVKTNWGDGLPPWRARDAANGEVTRDGVIILIGGQAVDDDIRETLNDGGRCNEDATFDDRRDLMTVLDDEGYLYVAGGSDWARDLTFNDVWRSSFSFNNVTAVGLACGVTTPACGPGLTCWPGDPRTTFYSNGSVTCPASRQCAGVGDAFLDFDVQTAAAGWRGRWAANAEVFPKPFTWRDQGNAARTMPANSLILQGGQSQNNDVWASTDGRFWDLVAGYAEYASQGSGRDVRAGGTAYLTSFSPPLSEATGIVDHKNGAIYRVGGYGSTGERNDVWRSTNVTVWTRMAASGLPPRSASNVVVDDRGKLFVVGGVNLGQTLNDIWFSVNNGSSFGRVSLSVAPFFKPGRGKGFLLHRYSQFLRKDVLYYGAGWNGYDMYNDLWVSSDDAASWTQVTANAPYAARDAVAGEITDAGLIVLAGGQAGAYTMNDVWVTADGGYTWGACSTETFWPDRREIATVLDRDGFLYILGGRSDSGGGARQFNDVYRSSFTFNDLSKVALACQVNMPACGPGLSCWPNAPDTVVVNGVVSCPALRSCQAAAPRSSSSTGRSVPSSSSVKKPSPPRDPCLDDPQYDQWCPGYVSSTGAAGGKASGLGAWAIGGIVVLVVAVVGGLALFVWRRHRPAEEAALHKGTAEKLLPDTATADTDD